jgi:uncharacterized membrane protein HdeD (DUF308 family)
MNREMEAAMSGDISDSASSGLQGHRAAQVIRAVVLVAVGVAIAFSAPLHSQLSFDLWVLGGGLALIGAATLLEYLALRGSSESWWIAARAVVAFAAAGSLLAVSDSFTMALVVALWAALTAVITGMRLVRKTQPAKVAVPSLLLSAGLAVSVLLFRDDAVAVIGFFGAYALIRGVFLGIAAFDPRPMADDVLSSTEASE